MNKATHQGLKQLVKANLVTAKSAHNRLMAKADLNKEYNLSLNSRTAKWLRARIK